MERSLREVASSLGIAHLFAISGFHLGVLTFVLYMAISPIYKYFQCRFFTYRNRFYDINMIILIVALIYLFVIDFSPSFLRSFVMFAFGLFAIFSGVALLSFRLLFACVAIILSLSPHIIFSIGFWLSVSGVFYIYLFLQYFNTIPKSKNGKILYAIMLNISVFLHMFPLSHYFFYTFSVYQIFSPFLTLIFVGFYPLALFLHIVGFGGIFDSILYRIFSHNYHNINLQTPLWVIIPYILCSLLSIKYRLAYYLLIIFCILFFASVIYLVSL